jgi:hypothetical protein
MEIKDYQGKEISEGTTLKYLGTRTSGKADKIITRKNNTWIRLDTTGLYYRLDYLMVIPPEEDKKRTSRKSPKNKLLKNLEQISHKNYEISSDSDGPGVGGG